MSSTQFELGGPPGCPLCASTGCKPLCRVEEFGIWRCAGCCVDFVFPSPDSSTLKKLYDRSHWFEGGEKGGYQSYDLQTTPLLPHFEELLAKLEPLAPERSILDIGCGYGSHLAIAAQRGWKCFGVEVSEHARGILEQRHGADIFVAESVERLIPHKFGLILMLDVLEHMTDPVQRIFDLFSRGAIVPETRVLITTPNARSYDAVRNPAAWLYRHPPSHLFYYSAESLVRLLNRLQFTQIEVSGIHPIETESGPGYGDEHSARNDELVNFAGLEVIASGSNFAEFMHERYVPGTWSKLAQYEHLPRYLLAREMAAGGRTLDFGCGTGYGSALVAETADSVLGLDLDAKAVEWARTAHRKTNLRFEQNDDLARNLTPTSFDLITCFEVIEHVDEATQRAMVQSFVRLLKHSGKLLISTPNPAVTANYGENPYHLREMNEQEFLSLLRGSFEHVEMMTQRIQPSVLIELDQSQFCRKQTGDQQAAVPPVAYVAVCSHRALGGMDGMLYTDSFSDYVFNEIQAERAYNQLQFRNYQSFEKLAHQSRQITALGQALAEKEVALVAVNQELHHRNVELALRNTEVTLIQTSKWWRLREALKEPLSPHKFVRTGYLIGAMATPMRVRQWVHPAVARLKHIVNPDPIPAQQNGLIAPEIHPRRAVECAAVTKVSVVIPTKNAGPGFRSLLQRLLDQKFEAEVELLVVDSGSRDETQALAWQYGAQLISIPPREFNHGQTRNLGVFHAVGDVVIFLTQDALPGDERLISSLVDCFSDPAVAGAYGRQVPRPDADPITQQRLDSWITGMREPHSRCIENAQEYAGLTPRQRYEFCNFDNVCSAIRRSVLLEFPFARVPFGEDVEWGKRVLEAGWKIVYQPEAWVVHSHERSFRYEYRRNYECHRQLKKLFGLQTIPTMSAAMRAVLASIRDDWSYLGCKSGRDWSLLARIPAMNLAGVLGQYRGARAR